MRSGLRRAVLLLVLTGVAVLGAFLLAPLLLRSQIEAALGPRGEVAKIEVGFGSVVLHDVRIRAVRDGKQGWPTDDELRARRVDVRPQLRDLLSARVRIERITVDGAYLSLLRTRDGALRVLPALLEQSPVTDDARNTPVPVHVSRIELRDASLDFHDASVRRTPHRLALQALNAEIGPVDLPALDTASTLKLEGIVKGVRQDGRLTLQGEVVPATRDARLALSLRDVDLVAFQPYLIKAAETGVKRGTMDLDIRPVVVDKRLKAPGTLTLNGLELASGGSFMGLPRAAVVGLMKDRDERISVDFTLEGRIDDPSFSLNEGFATRVTGAVAESVGVSLGGLVRGVGSAGSSVVKGVGDAVGKLLGD
ncbi:DUF748 domain-containing protein [Methyloversatilis sp.]|uniref:DUF748 domain-containing protein n=1 Tax=Methyloversatilis sp. TaxID=2569862 RepID=UPI0027BA6AF1|nr:DUF748 domain-containing protein [Methyloversatilis sp.]